MWHQIPDTDIPDEGRVQTLVLGDRTLAISRIHGTVGVLDNHCPHQGGPLGEGSIERGWLRCPWHGYDYDPLTGKPPAGFSDAPQSYPVEVRQDGTFVDLPELSTPVRTVGDVVVETLNAWGVTTVFGMVGHSNLGLAEAMRRAEDRGDLRYIGIRHEGAASFAASAYGKLTGKPAACFAIAGPGSTNLLTGLYDAKLDHAPVIALSGQVPSAVLGRGAFQDVDLTAVFADVAISSNTVGHGSNHSELTALAVKHALDSRGVAHLVFPDEVQVQPSDQPVYGPGGRLADRRMHPSDSSLSAAMDLITAAKRPVIIVGDGARAARAEVRELAETLRSAVLTTFRAKGLIPDNHPLGAGVLGRSGTPVASWLMNESDLLIVIGASSSNHTGIADYKPTIFIDNDPAGIGRYHEVSVGLQGDATESVRELLARLTNATHQAIDQGPDIAQRWSIWREEKTRRALDDRGRGLPAAAVFAALSSRAPADACFTVDVGNNAYSFGRYFESAGQHVLMSGYLGSIGFAYPAAMGAWAADPKRTVIAVNGDGGFGQYLAEVTTAVKYGMPIKQLLLDNGNLGKITKEQLAADFPVWQTSLVNPDFTQYTRLCGAWATTVDSIDQLNEAMDQWLAVDGPALLHVRQDAALV